MLLDAFPNVPDHIVDLFGRSAEISIDLTLDHAPHRVTGFLYSDGFQAHLEVLQLNSRSPFSVRVGDSLRLYDRRIISSLKG